MRTGTAEPVAAIVLAGGRNKSEMAAAAGEEMRALIPFRGRPMFRWVVEALGAADSVGEITVVGPVPESEGFRVTADRGGFVENVYAGLEKVPTEASALISTSDIPFLTSQAVDDFVRLARAEEADIVYPIVGVEDCYREFPGLKRTALRLIEGEYTGGNMVLVRQGFMDSQRERLAQAYGLRKSPLGLALMIGMSTSLKLGISIAARRPLLSLVDLESAISRVVGGKARAVISRHAEIATDIDRPSDLAAAVRIRPEA